MSIKKLRGSNKKSGIGKLAIEGGMTIYQAGNLRDGLLAESAQYSTIHLDLSAVDEFDCAGLQLLLGLERLVSRSGSHLHIDQCSPAVSDVLHLFQMAQVWQPLQPAIPH